MSSNRRRLYAGTSAGAEGGAGAVTLSGDQGMEKMARRLRCIGGLAHRGAAKRLAHMQTNPARQQGGPGSVLSSAEPSWSWR
jgi:hypothetical protein